MRTRRADDGDAVKLVRRSPPAVLPDIVFLDGSGSPTSLARARGKVVVLNIWATWCPPCRREMPALDRLQAELGGADVEVIALSIDTGPGAPVAIRAFYAAVGVRHLGVFIDPSGNAGVQLGASGIPTTLVLDKEGRELGRMTGPAAWDGPEVTAYLREQAGAP
jgi:thiol-disulfide isomerase/thioredoxin